MTKPLLELVDSDSHERMIMKLNINFNLLNEDVHTSFANTVIDQSSTNAMKIASEIVDARIKYIEEKTETKISNINKAMDTHDKVIDQEIASIKSKLTDLENRIKKLE